MKKKKLFLDLDDTFLDTDRFIRYMLKRNGVSEELVNINDDIYVLSNHPECRDIIEFVTSNYSIIPKKVGAKESLKILKTEYDVIFVTASCREAEYKSKEALLIGMGVPYIITGSDKTSVDMTGGIQVDDHLIHLNQSNAETKIFFYNKYEMIPNVSTGTLEKGYKVAKDWFQLTDILMSGGEDIELRKFICQRVQKCCEACRV